MKRVQLFFTGMLMVVAAAAQHARPATKEDLLNDTYCTGLFRTANATYFDLMEEPDASSSSGYLNILDWLQGRVAGLQIYQGRNNVSIPYIRNQRAAVYVNEVRVDYDFLSALSPNDIAMIKVMKGISNAVPGGAGGTIAIYTIRGDEYGDTDGQ